MKGEYMATPENGKKVIRKIVDFLKRIGLSNDDISKRFKFSFVKDNERRQQFYTASLGHLDLFLDESVVSSSIRFSAYETADLIAFFNMKNFSFSVSKKVNQAGGIVFDSRDNVYFCQPRFKEFYIDSHSARYLLSEFLNEYLLLKEVEIEYDILKNECSQDIKDAKKRRI